uniref:Uncharacterized protein n=1 Tax=Rhizophora mucronata TaxID=61149 RepID=A0A2P2QHA5_RHIMU
MNSVKKIMR